MFYVSSTVVVNVANHHEILWGVTDSEDNIEEFYLSSQLLNLNGVIDIDGVDYHSGLICVVKPKSHTLTLLKRREFHSALRTMTLKNESFGLAFKRMVNKDAGLVTHKILNIARSGVNNFNINLGYSKSYRSGLTIDDVMAVCDEFANWTLKDAIIGEF